MSDTESNEMSRTTGQPSDDSADPWAAVAEHEDTLEMVVEEDVPFAEDARRLLDRLEEEGYR